MNRKKISLISVWAAVAAAWLGLVALYFFGSGPKIWAVAVTVTAVATELAFWATAGLLGLTVWESRARVLRMLSTSFRRSTLDGR